MKENEKASGTNGNRLSAADSGNFKIGTDRSIHRLGFGAMRITGPGIWGEPQDRDEAIRVLRRAIELGINFIDTADSYGPEVSERIIAEALYPYPKDLVIATKAGFDRPGPDQWRENGRPEICERRAMAVCSDCGWIGSNCFSCTASIPRFQQKINWEH